MELNEISESNIGVQAKVLAAVLVSHGYSKISDTIYQQSLIFEKKNVIMRFQFENADMKLLYGEIKVLLKEEGSNSFEVIGIGELRSMRIAPMGKILGIRSLPKKQRFDRAKYRRNIREGKAEYQRGDK